MATKTYSLRDVAECDSFDKRARMLARIGVGMAMDNASDMLGVDVDEHVAENWHGYIRHAVEMYCEDIEHDNDDDFEEMVDAARRVAPLVFEDEGVELNVSPGDVLNEEDLRILADQMFKKWDLEYSAGNDANRYKVISDVLYYLHEEESD